VSWDTSASISKDFDSAKAKEEYARAGRDPNAKTMDAYKVGDAPAALKSAAKVVEATYWSEYCYHAQMEPMTAVAKVAEDGQSADIWVGTQFGALAANIISGILKTTPDKVKIHQQMLGGGYGRRIWPDAAIQATILSNITKKPVKLILTREDDVAAARPRPMTHHILKAGLERQAHRLAPSAGVRERGCRRFAAPLQGHRRSRLHRLARPRSGVLQHPARAGGRCSRGARHAGARVARHRLGLQQVRGRSFPR
jgi:isoquinoline 1-oxidoreductase beta subunit